MVLAGWFDARITECSQPRPARGQMFGIEIVDPLGFADPNVVAARTVFLGDEIDDTAACFDAVAVVSSRWGSATPAVLRPGEFATRRRVGVVTVVSDLGAATALRWDFGPNHVVLSAGVTASCPLGSAVAWWWTNARR